MGKGIIDSIVDALVASVLTDDWVGRHGERLTERELHKGTRAIEGESRVLRNVYVPTDDGRTSEIDVLCLTIKGVFVIESKNYSGWIFGNEKDRYWTQCLPGGEKNRFYNPVWQNRGHVKWLRKYLADDTPLYSLVVFSERCELKKVTVESEDVRVIKRDKLVSVVQGLCARSATVLDEEQLKTLHQRLSPLTDVTKAQKQAHVQAIEQQQGKGSETLADSDEDSLVCPRCGGTLVLRVAKRGEYAGNEFYGCSNYPRCRYIRNL